MLSAIPIPVCVEGGTGWELGAIYVSNLVCSCSNTSDTYLPQGTGIVMVICPTPPKHVVYVHIYFMGPGHAEGCGLILHW